ncbi:TetR/AcrR family transcriptional regulator [Mycolicibacterium sediminis]|uniref:TetR family transcriptional regulator n=1 Tax=Mycolicibacterium sediminis TaxID=1286180 RepID=A0A7I7QZM2_9MYCO|nr:TetR/AcrR family transcriptional regulator [Mycolicibacterium sediminis]BBY31801.1 TetR family transcriptional regulator [Mycolicibacterium sediminis]
MSGEEPRRRGRRRSEESRQAILTAAFDLVAEEGQDFTIEGIAARAGVSKQTIYRWWPTKGDILLESLAEQAEARISTSDRDSYLQDLRHFLDQTFTVLRPPGVRSALRSLMAEAQQNPELLLRFREEFLERRRASLLQIVSRAEVRGDLPPRVRSELVADIVFGVIWYRMLATDRLLDGADAGSLAGLLASHE